MSPQVITILASIGIYLLGMGVLWIGFRLRRRALAFLDGSIETLGTVIDVQHLFSAQGPIYAPVVSYEDSKGMTHLFQSNSGSDSPQPALVGTRQSVFYQADTPQNAKLGPRKTVLYPSRACFVGGVILLLFGTVTWLVFPLPPSNEPPEPNPALQNAAGEGRVSRICSTGPVARSQGNVNVKSETGLTPLQVAVISGKTDVVALLKQRGAKE